MDLVIAGGRGLGLTLEERRQLGALQAERAQPPTEAQVAYDDAASEPMPSDFSSTHETRPQGGSRRRRPKPITPPDQATNGTLCLAF